MNVVGIHHVNLVVDDLDAARRFYGEVLAFEELPRPNFGFPGAWYRAGAQQIHLQVGDAPAPKSVQHFALEVTDLDAVVERLATRGMHAGGVPHTRGAGRQAFLTDPAGNLIELNEPDPEPRSG